jgi:S4 domain protein YaaA
MAQIVRIKEEYITLGQLLKLTDCVSTGGQVKPFLQENAVLVNGQPEARRGRKLYPGDRVEVGGFGIFEVESSS